MEHCCRMTPLWGTDFRVVRLTTIVNAVVERYIQPSCLLQRIHQSDSLCCSCSSTRHRLLGHYSRFHKLVTHFPPQCSSCWTFACSTIDCFQSRMLRPNPKLSAVN